MQFSDSFEFLLLIGVAVFALFVGRYFRTLLTWVSVREPSLEKEILNAMPALLWVQVDNKVIWENEAFSQLQSSVERPVCIQSFDISEGLVCDGKLCRAVLSVTPDGKKLYFDVSKRKFGNKSFYAALSAKAAVTAESDRARFVQTLSETFAHLSTGMAVFDKERDLSLFNPALAELLEVNPLWLAKKPSLRDFLDRLHDKGALPEPRNFKSWRDQIVEMEKSAEAGAYFDDWHMPNDKVFRVTGRPHPKGAVAFIFEDISRTISAEREYRLEIERLYMALDSLSGGVIIFDSSGTLSFANTYFDNIWKTELSKNLVSPTAVEVAEIWNEKCEPTPVLGEIREFILSVGERANWSGPIKTKSGVSYEMRATVMVGGYSMIAFCPKTPQMMAAQ